MTVNFNGHLNYTSTMTPFHKAAQAATDKCQARFNKLLYGQQYTVNGENNIGRLHILGDPQFFFYGAVRNFSDIVTALGQYRELCIKDIRQFCKSNHIESMMKKIELLLGKDKKLCYKTDVKRKEIWLINNDEFARKLLGKPVSSIEDMKQLIANLMKVSPEIMKDFENAAKRHKKPDRLNPLFMQISELLGKDTLAYKIDNIGFRNLWLMRDNKPYKMLLKTGIDFPSDIKQTAQELMKIRLNEMYPQVTQLPYKPTMFPTGLTPPEYRVLELKHPTSGKPQNLIPQFDKPQLTYQSDIGDKAQQEVLKTPKSLSLLEKIKHFFHLG